MEKRKNYVCFIRNPSLTLEEIGKKFGIKKNATYIIQKLAWYTDIGTLYCYHDTIVNCHPMSHPSRFNFS